MTRSWKKRASRPAGFTPHFSSKDALLAEALEHYAAQSSGKLAEGLSDRSDLEQVGAIVDRYLRPEHRERPENGCPLPSLAPEVSRASEASRQAFERLVDDLIATFAARLPPNEGQHGAIALAAICVGGMTLARAVHDPGLSDRILKACRDFAHENIEGRPRSQGKEPGRRRTVRDK